MAFRRMRRAPRGRRRTKTLWDRAVTLVEFEGGLDPMLAQTIGDPRILPGSLAGFDLLRTVRRIIVNMNFTMELDLNVVAQGDMVCGIYVGDRNAPVISPLFLTSGELEADWLDLWLVPWRTPATGNQSQAYPVDGSYPSTHRDIRVNRKLDTDDVIIFVASPSTVSGAIAVAGGFCTLQQSLLWTATPT